MMKTNEQSLPGGGTRAKTPANEKIDIPKLRKNRKHELRWGAEYFNALKETVFTVELKSYVPAVMPKELRNENEKDEQIYMCKQCNDSFHFKSSLDDHENRKSCIIGYWCSHCFSVNCTHTQEEKSMCLLCQNIENKNRARLSRRGLKRGQKMGSVQVFYNQCQFFAHLKLHNVTVVDMAYIMLMPVPSELENSELSHLHEACKAIMEYAFVKQKHAIDVLRNVDHNSKWWMSEPSDSSPIGELLKKYLIDSCDEFAYNTDDSNGEIAQNPRADSPIPTDITFVDCGPTAKVFIPSKTKTSSSPSQTSILKSTTAKFSHVPSLDSLKKNCNNLPTNASEKGAGNLSDNNKSPEVMSKLPEMMKNKLTIIKKDGMTTSVGGGASLSIDKGTTSIAGKSELAKTVVTPSLSVPVLSNTNKPPEKLIKLPPGGKLVIQNGRKYIIRQIQSCNLLSKDIQKTTTNDSRGGQNSPANVQQPRIPQLLSPTLKNRKIHLPRNYLASEFHNNANLNSLESGAKGMEVLLKKYHLDLRKRLLNYSKQRIQTIVDSVSEFSKNFSKAGFVDLEAISMKNLATLKQLRGYLETASDEPVRPSDHKINNDFKNRLTTWEFQRDSYDICQACNKKQKPKKYFIGISKPAIQEDYFCQCYNFICHLCKAKQGNANRYKEHLKFHNNQPPYKCPECFTSFPNMQNLEIHIWTKCFHLYTQEIFACRVCEMEGFFTMEALSRHYYEVHTRSVVVCPRCPTASCSYSEHLLHYSNDHTDAPATPDPESLIICDLGGCLVSPENFNLHMESHREIGTIQYYTCPFCDFFIKNVNGNENVIQDHVFMNHSERLSEIITPETLNFFTSSFNLRMEHPVNKLRQTREKGIILPKIVNACSIAPTAFEQVSSRTTATPKPIRLNTSTASTPRVSTGMTIPKIVHVQSMNPVANPTINNTTNSKPKFTLQTLQSGKLVAIPMSYVTNSLMQQRPVTLKLNLFDKNSNQVNDKKVLATSTPTPTIANTKSVSPIPQLSLSETTGNYYSTPVEKQLGDTSEAIGDVEPDKLQVAHSNLECTEDFRDIEQDKLGTDNIVEPTFTNRNIDHAERLKTAEEALKRRGRPKKPWRIALDGADDLNSPPLNFKCHLCYENITTAWEVIKHHFAVKHFREYKLCVVTPRLEKITSSEEIHTKIECKKRKSEPTSPRGASRRKRRAGLTKIEDSSRSGICVTQEKLEQIEGNFKCKKCEELFQDIKMLREHFANKHRIKGHFLVCLECGENFVVANSLQMHLKAFHGIIDTHSYLAQNSLYAPDIGGSLDARTTEPNQCYVCMAVFENKSAVDKHLRVHGMAFLNHTRIEARNASKIDEKKTEVAKKQKVERKDDKQNGDNDANSGSILTRISMLLS